MKRHHVICDVVLAICLICLLGCAAQPSVTEPGTASTEASSASGVVSSSDVSAHEEPEVQGDEVTNMVDERFELLSLVFRLAGNEEYSEVNTPYQQTLMSTFSSYKEHAAAQYASELRFGYDAVFKFAVHLQKDGDQFVFIDDIASLVEDGRWTRQSATEFLELLNAFYTESAFAAFYQSNLAFYETETQRFVEGAYSAIDLAWFGTYVDANNLHCIYSPASTRNNYGATVNDTKVYCAVSGKGGSIVHEYCHSFANPIAHKWYEENPAFRKWCDDTIDPVKMPYYASGETIAAEYVTRAYDTLYHVEHGYAPISLFLQEQAQGFPYIEEVYAMTAPYQKPQAGDDKIKSMIGVGYEMGDEKLFSIGERTFRRRVLSLAEPLSYIFMQTEVGNLFGSKTGEVLYVEDSGEKFPYLLIDLGEATYKGKTGYRSYSRVPIEK